MSELSAARQVRQADSKSRLHLTAVISVITGVALLAGGAFLLSYARIHEMALFAGVSPSLAAVYPLMFDITLVIACVATLALRGARWWMRAYAALSITVLLAVVAVAEAVHSAGISLPYGPSAAAFAALPWVLFLIGFSLGLLVLRYLRTMRAKARAARKVAVTAAVSSPTAVIPVADQRADRPRPRIGDPHAADVGVDRAQDTPATPTAPVRPATPVRPDMPVASDTPVTPARPSPSKHPSPPDVSSTPASEHRHEHAHRHHQRAGDDHGGGC
jgi:hypothetical protein